MPTPKRITLYGGPAHGCQVPPWQGIALHVACDIRHGLPNHADLLTVIPFRIPPSLTAIYLPNPPPKGHKRPISAQFSNVIYHEGIPF